MSVKSIFFDFQINFFFVFWSIKTCPSDKANLSSEMDSEVKN